MAGTISLTINGIEKAETILRGGTWSIQKRMATETMNLTVKNDVYSTAAYKPVVGDSILAYHGTDLIFGGQIRKVKRYRVGGDGPLFVDVQCRGWELLAEQSIFTRTLASESVLQAAYQLFQYYLEPKGVTWLGATTGGPVIPKMVVTHASLADVYTRMQKLTNYMWRINGEKKLGFNAPNSLPFPKNPMLGTDFEKGLFIEQDYFERATRLIMTTGGSGDKTHTETHTGNGVKTNFPLNVEPKAPETDSNNVTTSYWPTKVTVNGVEHTLGAGVWAYDSLNHVVYKATAGAVPSGHNVVTSYTVGFPAVVRVWEQSVLKSDGFFDFQFLVDKALNIGHITDVAEAKAWGDVEILDRGGSPLTIKGNTRIKGFYPLLTGTVTITDDAVNSSFLVQSVNIKDPGDVSGKDFDTHLVYELDLIEGDSPGRHHDQLFKEWSSGGVSGGGGIAVGGSGGTITSPGGGSGGGGGTGAYPIGHTIQVGGDNTNAYPATTTFADIPEMQGNKFGAVTGVWKFQAFGFQLSAGTMEIQLFAGGVQIALASSTAVGALLSGPVTFTPVAVTVPSGVVDLLCRYRVTAGTRDVVVGHCFLYRES